MDLEIFKDSINWVWGLIGVPILGYFKYLTGRINNMQETMKNIEIDLPNSYVKNERMDKLEEHITTRMDKIEINFNHKLDKHNDKLDLLISSFINNNNKDS